MLAGPPREKRTVDRVHHVEVSQHRTPSALPFTMVLRGRDLVAYWPSGSTPGYAPTLPAAVYSLILQARPHLHSRSAQPAQRPAMTINVNATEAWLEGPTPAASVSLPSQLPFIQGRSSTPACRPHEMTKPHCTPALPLPLSCVASES